MSRKQWMGIVLATLIGLAIAAAPAFAKKDKSGTATTPPAAEPKITLPDPASKAIKDAFPAAIIGDTKMQDEGGMSLYATTITDGLASKTVVVSSDGLIAESDAVVSDVKDIPDPIIKAIETASDSGTVVRYLKGDMRYQVKDGKLTKLETSKTAYIAELTKGYQEGRVKVALDGTVLLPVTWQMKKSATTTPAPTTPKKKNKKNP